MADEYSESVSIPQGVTAQVDGSTLIVKGEKGSIQRDFTHPRISIAVDDKEVVFKTASYTRAEKKFIKSYLAHVRNMFHGATQGHEYKLKICSGHFPMNVSVKGNTLEVKNFIGEVVPRTLTIQSDVKVGVKGEEIVVTGIQKEKVSQVAASIEKLTRRNGFDKRTFQDGIYITQKDSKPIK
ncbi:MAG: 50S ribosomal protein L6 [Candidatus Nanoarchaeia archaeon]